MQNKPKDKTHKGTIKSEAIAYFDEKALQANITTEKSRQSKNSVVKDLIYVFIVLNSFFLMQTPRAKRLTVNKTEPKIGDTL